MAYILPFTVYELKINKKLKIDLYKQPFICIFSLLTKMNKTMKKLITLFTILIFTAISFAQTAKVEGDKALLEEKLSNNIVEFIMPSETTSEDVSKSAQYYTEYFTVEYDDDSKVAKIVLVNEDPIAKRVITRFLLSTGVRTINFSGEDHTIMGFYSTFLE